MDLIIFCIFRYEIKFCRIIKKMNRRKFIQSIGTGFVASAAIDQTLALDLKRVPKQSRVIIVGAGFGGLTTAKYLRIYSEEKIEVILIDPTSSFISTPLSNLVFSGQLSLQQLTFSRENVCKKYGIQLVKDSVSKIDPESQKVKLASGSTLTYDRLVLSPGVSLMLEQLPSLAGEKNPDALVHAIQAGSQTTLLKKQLEAMPNGGLFAISVPLAPYRCPPAPYERACQVALYFQKFKPRSKILILDANQDVTSKSALFKKTWANSFPGMIEYRNNHTLMDINLKENELIFEVQDEIKADVLNIIPMMRAGNIAHENGLTNINQRWCGVDFGTYESNVIPRIHVIGDAIQGGDLMPKSAQIAYGQGKACAMSVTKLILQNELNLKPHYNSLCYSFLTSSTAAHVSTDHIYDEQRKTMAVIQGSQEISTQGSTEDYQNAMNWATNIWNDILS